MTQEQHTGNAARTEAETLPHYRLMQLEWISRDGCCNDALAANRKNGGIT